MPKEKKRLSQKFDTLSKTFISHTRIINIVGSIIVNDALKSCLSNVISNVLISSRNWRHESFDICHLE